MIERWNSATNLLGLVLVIAGIVAAYHSINVGMPVITGGIGLMTGHIANGRNDAGKDKTTPDSSASGA